MPGPTVKEGHVDQLLSNVSVAYIQGTDRFIAHQVFPLFPVEKASDFYLEFPRGYFFRDYVGRRPIGGYSPVAGFDLEKKPYNCEEEGLTAFLDDRERANATPPYDPERAKVRFLTQQHCIHRDRLWANAYMKPGVWTTDLTGVASSPGAGQFLQFDNANSDPIGLIDQQRDSVAKSTGFEPNTVVCGRDVFRSLKNHPDIIDRVKYTQRGVITQELLAQMFNVNKFLVPGGIENTAAEGAADSFSFIIPSKAILLVYAAPEIGLDMPTGGWTFSWRGLLGAQGLEAPVWRGRDDRAHSDWFEVRMAYDMHIVAPDLGVYLNNAVG